MVKMDVRRLQAFAKVYELRSFSRAGEELLLSQPTISAHISALEEELETQLFDRLGRTVLPTQAGDVLYRYCTTIFTQLDHAKADIMALSARVAGELVIGGSTIPAHYIIPRLVARYVDAYPEVRVDMTGGDTSEIAQKVADGTVHVGIVGAPAPYPELVSLPYLDDALVVVAPASLSLPDMTESGWQDRLAGLPWIMREQGSGTRQTLEASFAKGGMDIRNISPVLVVHSSLAVLECVEAGLGVAAVSTLAAKTYLERGTVAGLEVPHLDMRRSFYVIHHGKRYLFPALRAFLKICGFA
ncbi:selenium metabolism-associated LysR family transcriptional regulator [Solidesulfovibrio magneticus]|uniref:LysR family transcriptional regulator n=1 Tax=Solidesulfovibrio magneticus (strain ATCC 700980 / DSM 13731 / RS-1) TaxID=573370 RepID=C4XLK5_SOLM1|nr:selenium metabolism-associated LysR family transcriptional regulator [Solidesulfovibrio magneticus]BAH74739.1 LysR family transcriptional regulator [Solidesulfovibrio magneticus RS-1]